MDAQFQLGFELTNILDPITQTISTISSVATVDAARKAGSDVLTEVKLASFLGKNRIDRTFEAHFRQVVTQSKRNLISRYLEIALESGAGPTVQHALKHTALFSMIVQMSLLCFVHEHQPFANAMVEAIERIAKDFKGIPNAIPDYPSLLGTLRVIQRETAGFQWSELLDSVERSIQDKLWRADWHPGSPIKIKRPNTLPSSGLKPYTSISRGLPFPVLQALLLALESLQRFSEKRQIFIECDTGFTTIVVWCYHVLGLGVKMYIEDREITFGDRPFNVLVKVTFERSRTRVSLIIPTTEDEPLFTLSSNGRDPKLETELRVKFLNFGQVVLRGVDVKPHDMVRACYTVIANAVTLAKGYCSCNNLSWSIENVPRIHAAKCKRNPRESVAKIRIFGAARILFGLQEIDEAILKEASHTVVNPMFRKACEILIALLLSLSRVQAQDLEQCHDMPLSIKVFQKKLGTSASVESSDLATPNITESFGIITHYLLGQRHSDSFVEQTLLVSECGWSVFFDIVDANDPSDESTCNLRILAGVPSIKDASQNTIVKDRILDGPTESAYLGPHPITTLRHRSTFNGGFLSDLSTANRGDPLIGFRDGDAFLATQSYTWQHKEHQIHVLGLRQMVDLCNDVSLIPACACDNKTAIKLESLEGRQVFIVTGSNVERKLPEDLDIHELSGAEYVVFFVRKIAKFLRSEETDWMFHATKNSASRWLHLDIMRRTLQVSRKSRRIFIRDNECCMSCAYQHLSDFGGEPLYNLVLL